MEKKQADNKINTRKKGVVTSKPGEKTIVVSVDIFKTHPKYKKKFRSTKKYKAHDQENKYKVGNKVEIINCRPISKDKKYKVM